MMAVKSAVALFVTLSTLGLAYAQKAADLSACKGETSFIKDGECDVDLNNAECMWDGGDCCECECEPGGEFLCGGFGFRCLDPESACHVLESVCSNGIPGIESAPNDDGERACCPRVCGQCGGPVCFSAGLPEYDETGCCDNSVMNFHKDCDDTGASPCVINSEVETCSNGIPGFEGTNENGTACCPLGCTMCGGLECATAGEDSNLDNTSCCINGVLKNQPSCSADGSAPCVIEVAPSDTTPAPSETTPAPTTLAPTSSQGATCSNGIPGLEGTNENGTACCPIGCTACGGLECATAGEDNNLDNTSCCINGVLKNQLFCSAGGSAPCVIEVAPSDTTPAPSDTTPAPTTLAPTSSQGPTCSNGIPGIENQNENGVVCCDAGCGTCGGSGCKALPGGRTNCCVGAILDGGDDCDASGVAPCFISVTNVS